MILTIIVGICNCVIMYLLVQNSFRLTDIINSLKEENETLKAENETLKNEIEKHKMVCHPIGSVAFSYNRFTEPIKESK
jgi:hypothetical protein